jgi:hypothetical protein
MSAFRSELRFGPKPRTKKDWPEMNANGTILKVGSCICWTVGVASLRSLLFPCIPVHFRPIHFLTLAEWSKHRRWSKNASQPASNASGPKLTGFRRAIIFRGSCDAVAVAQLVRAPDCGSGGRGFKSPQPPFLKIARKPVNSRLSGVFHALITDTRPPSRWSVLVCFGPQMRTDCAQGLGPHDDRPSLVLQSVQTD